MTSVVTLELEVHELEALAGRVDRFASSRRRIFGEMMEDIGDDIAEVARDRISDNNVDPDGDPWKPWSSSYADSGQGVSLLERTGKMRKSFRVKSSSKTMSVRNIAKYAPFHQGGTGRMPARPILGWGRNELAIASAGALQALREALHQ